MRAVRRGAIIGGTVVGSLLAVLVAVDCASPTQIIIDVRADKDLCEDSANPLAVGFGVTKQADVEKLDTALQDFQNGCKVKADGIVGTMVIKPSDDKNATIGIRVVAAVGGDPSACQNDQSDCIIATRLVTFQPGQTVRETVSLSGACKGEVCGENQDCVAGKCVDRSAINDDGGVEPDAGHPTDPDVFVPLPDTFIPDTGPGDACARCTGGTTHSCNAGVCTIVCSDPNDCQATNLCVPGLDCNIVCPVGNACVKTHCENPGNCTFDCGGQMGGNHCQDITCDAGNCTALCADSGSLACNGATLSGKNDNTVCVEAVNGDVGCDHITSGAKNGTSTSRRSCGITPDAGGCGDAATCNGDQQGNACKDFTLRPPDPPPPVDDAGH